MEGDSARIFASSEGLPMSRSILLVLAVWAVGYLAALGSSELRSEEGHRVIPAVEMLESGDYLVPHIGGQPYLRKPPLINWLIAGSFKVFHVRNEWAARMPSALFVLAVAIFFALGTRHILGARGSVIAALCWLTNLGMLEMGRSIEIEAVYISLFTVALIFWLVSWQQDRSPWLTWTVPWIFLGLGLLAKGPAHLFFFYALIFGVLRRTGRLREFIKLPHLFGIIVLLGVFGAWLVPYLLELRAQYPLQTWWYELSNIVRGDEISSQNWWLGFPRRLAYFLPWILLLPFIRLGKIADAHQREICRGLVWGSLVAFLVMLPWPGVRPRYILPLLAPFCWVIGAAVAADAFEWTIAVKRFQVRISSKAIATFVALGAVVAIIVFPLRGATILRRSTKIRSLAAQINAAIPPGERLYAVNPRWQPYLFYVHAPITYLKTLDELPSEARYFLVTPENWQKVETSQRWGSSRPRMLAWTTKYRGEESILFVLEPR